MTSLADIPLTGLQAGMKVRHPEHGEQIILDVGYGQIGPAIWFHNSEMYDGRMPQVAAEGEEEVDIFALIAQKTYPNGATDWEYLGLVDQNEVAAHGWHWLQVTCPHCSFDHRLLAVAPSSGQRRCRSCGMVFDRPLQPIDAE